MKSEEIKYCIESFNNKRKANLRYTSFDYCFNYFQSFEDKKTITSNENLELSCLQLGFYLASWGMLRGSSEALNHSVKWFAPVIEIISNSDRVLWTLDVDGYNEETLKVINSTYDQLAKALNVKTHITLVTKIMLGVYGCVPAFDNNFTAWHRSIIKGKQTFTQKLDGIKKFYMDSNNKDTIDHYARSLKTIEFKTESSANRCYTKAKIIDMIGFEIGAKINSKTTKPINIK